MRRLHDDIPEADPTKQYMRSQKEIFPRTKEYEGRRNSASESLSSNDTGVLVTPTTDTSFGQSENDREMFGESSSPQTPGHPPTDIPSDVLEESERFGYRLEDYLDPRVL